MHLKPLLTQPFRLNNRPNMRLRESMPGQSHNIPKPSKPAVGQSERRLGRPSNLFRASSLTYPSLVDGFPRSYPYPNPGFIGREAEEVTCGLVLVNVSN
ncbi:hypothetical protein BDW66DRAFT_142718 [Aspergillus desertorum]